MDHVIPFDLSRMLFGSLPPLFLLEIVLRVGVIWLWSITLLRWVGGRSISQMSLIEFLLVVALGSAVGDPMFQPEVPLFHAMLVILLVVLADKAVDAALRRWKRVKRLVDGVPSEVVSNCRIVHSDGDDKQLAPAEIMELLRLKGVRNLGEVEFAFMEPSGGMSVFLFDEPRPGLRIVPPIELRKLPRPLQDGMNCCTRCGLVCPSSAAPCNECGCEEWTVPD